MTAHDADRIIRAFLAEGREALPERSYAAVRNEIDKTRQRVVFGPWRDDQMLKFAGLIGAAVTAIVAVFVGVSLLGQPSSGVGGLPGAIPTPKPSASPTPSPSPSPTPSPSALTLSTTDVGRTLGAGTYRVDAFTAPFSVTLPEGWAVDAFTQNEFGLRQGSTGAISLYLIAMDKVYGDPCHPATPTVVGSSVDELVTALSSMPGVDVTGLTDVTIGGASGKSFTISSSVDTATANCTGNKLALGTFQSGGTESNVEMFGHETDRFWVVSAGGTRVLIAINDNAASLQSAVPLLDAITFG